VRGAVHGRQVAPVERAVDPPVRVAALADRGLPVHDVADDRMPEREPRQRFGRPEQVGRDQPVYRREDRHRFVAAHLHEQVDGERPGERCRRTGHP
jgi:hypothetical protein